MSNQSQNIVALIITTISTILMLAGFIVSILYLYQKKQINFEKNIETIKLGHEKSLLQAQLEVQEQTFQEISREIHDNISLSLTLSKLHLNTLPFPVNLQTEEKIGTAVSLIGDAIEKLRDISRSLNSSAIETYGLLEAVANETRIIEKTGIFKVNYEVNGEVQFLDSRRELIIFRIIQESFNNIIKHAHATEIAVQLNFDPPDLVITIADNGVGFAAIENDPPQHSSSGSGLFNISKRVRQLQGRCSISSGAMGGAVIRVAVPLNINE